MMLEIVCHVWQWSLGNWSYFQVEGKVKQTPVRKPLINSNHMMYLALRKCTYEIT